MHKKAITQTMFNWIFIAIAGALILLFFVSIAFKQKSVSEEKIDINIQENIRSLLANTEISKQTEQIIPMPDKEIKYSCQGFSIGSLSEFKPRVVFAPDLLKSNTKEMIFYSLEWRVPFRITNFLYITSPEVRYIIVDDNGNLNDKSIANKLYDLLPENINKGENVVNINNLNNILDTNNYKVKIVFFNNFDSNKIPVFTNTKEKDISVINIKPENNDNIDEYGKIDFYEYKTLKKTLPYLKKESIVAAIFSENYEIYKCNMEKAMEKLEHVYDVYEKRAEKLGNDESIECRNNYGTNYLNVNKDFQFNNLKKIYDDNMKNIKDQNQIVELNSCALIY